MIKINLTHIRISCFFFVFFSQFVFKLIFENWPNIPNRNEHGAVSSLHQNWTIGKFFHVKDWFDFWVTSFIFNEKINRSPVLFLGYTEGFLNEITRQFTCVRSPPDFAVNYAQVLDTAYYMHYGPFWCCRDCAAHCIFSRSPSTSWNIDRDLFRFVRGLASTCVEIQGSSSTNISFL